MKNFFLVLLIIFPFFGIAQLVDFKADGAVTNSDLGKKEAGVTIAMVQDGKTVASVVTATNGKYNVKGKIDISKPFELVYSKTNMVSKKISISFKGMNPEDVNPGGLWLGHPLDMDMFEKRPGVDFSFLESQPVGKFMWNTSDGYAKLDEPARKSLADKIDKLLKESEQNTANNDAAYNAAIKEADRAFLAKEYSTALTNYEKAVKLPGKGQEKHPNDRILMIEDIIQKEKEDALKFQQENGDYLNLIKAADNFYNAGDYLKAKEKYKDALDYKDEQYPKDRIKDCNLKISEKANEEKYKQVIAAADVFYNQRTWESALEKYKEALALKSGDAHATARIAEVEGKLKGEADKVALKQQFDALVAEADVLFKAENWTEAKAKYEEANKIESASVYVNTQITAVTKKIAEAEAERLKKEKIDKLIADGDAQVAAQKYPEAIAIYKQALALDAANSVATEKIASTQAIIDDLAKNKALNDQIAALVKAGDDAMTAKKYADAVSKFGEALSLRVDLAVQLKKENAEKALNEADAAKKIEEDFANLMAEGNSALGAKDYAQALEKYKGAEILKPQDATVKQKIADVTKVMGEQDAALAKQAKIEKLLQEATELMEGGITDGPQLEPAKKVFNEVLALDNANATAKAKIAQIDQLLAAQKASSEKLQKFNDLVKKGDDEMAASTFDKAIASYTEALKIENDNAVQVKLDQAKAQLAALADQKKLDEQYNAALLEANKLRDAGKLADALVKYEVAKTLKPSEAVPQSEIDKINEKLALEQSAAEKKQQIAALLAEGETKFTEKNYADAIAKFEQVKALESTNATALKRIADANAELAKMQGEEAKKQQIASLLSQGETALQGEDLTTAEAKFKEVLNLEKGNAAATKFLAEIATKQTLLKQQAETKDRFNSLVAKGDAAVSNSKWQEGIAAYTDALKIENSADVEQKLARARSEFDQASKNEADKAKYEVMIKAADALRDAKKHEEAIVKYQEALTLGVNAIYPQAEIEKINGVLAKQKSAGELKAQIDALVTEGLAAMASKDLGLAKSKFQSVQSLDDKNEIAKAKLIEIKKLEDAHLAKADEEKRFQEYKTTGLAGFNNKDYNNAMVNFEQALKIKDDAEIRSTIEKITALKAANEAQGKEIASLMAAGATAFSQKKWDDAKDKYEKVLAIDNSNAAAKAQLALIESEKLKELGAAKQEEEFQRLKAIGFTEAQNQDWAKAKHSLESALAIKKDEAVSKRLDEVKKAIADKEAEKRLEEDYRSAMAKAQVAEAAKDFTSAIANYTQANNLKESETLKTKIAELQTLLALQSKSTVEEQKYTSLIAEGDVFVTNKDFPNAIKKYKEAQSVKPKEKEPALKIAAAEKLAELQKNEEQDQAFEKLINAINTKLDENDFASAKDYVQRATSFRPNDPRIAVLATKVDKLEKEHLQFMDLMDKAKKEESRKKYKDAIALYEKAKAIKNSHPEPIAKIAELNALLASEGSAADKEKLFAQHMKAGEAASLTRSYENAIASYKSALQVLPNDSRAIAKLAEVEGLQAKAESERQLQAVSNERFGKLVMEADDAFKVKEYAQAITKYKEALELQKDNAYVKTQIAEAERILILTNSTAVNAQYQSFIELADRAYRDKDFTGAIANYEEAKKVKPSEAYPQKMIDEINGILNPLVQNSDELKDLGEPFSGTFEDAEQALKNAEAQRKDNKRNKVKQSSDKAYIANEELMQNKQNELTNTIGQIYNVYKQMQQDGIIAINDKIEIASTVRKSYHAQANRDAQNENYEHASVIMTQEQLAACQAMADNQLDAGGMRQIENHLEVDRVRVEAEDKVTARTDMKYDEITDVKNKVVAIEKAINQDHADIQVDKNEVVKVVDGKRAANEDHVTTRTEVKYDEITEVKNKVTAIENEIAAREQVVQVDKNEVAKIVDGKRVANEDKVTERTDVKYDEITAVKNKVTEIENAVIQEHKDIQVDKNEVVRIVDGKRVANENTVTQRTETKYTELVDNKEKVEQVEQAVVNRANANKDQLNAYMDDFKKIDNEIKDKDVRDEQAKYHEQVGVDARLKTTTKVVDDKEIQQEVKQVQNVEKVKELALAVDNREASRETANDTKNNELKKIIEAQDIRKDANQQKGTEAHVEKVKDMAVAQNTMSVEQDKAHLGDLNDRMSTQLEMDNNKRDEVERKRLEDERAAKKAEEMKELTKAMNNTTTSKELDKATQHYDTKTQIDKNANKPVVATVVPNELGTKYPEGISQEMFQRKDEAGILMAVVTRRIVVVQGRGEEYVRTQTSHATTYTKNGSPTTEFIWQNETNNAKLERHF